MNDYNIRVAIARAVKSNYRADTVAQYLTDIIRAAKEQSHTSTRIALKQNLTKRFKFLTEGQLEGFSVTAHIWIEQAKVAPPDRLLLSFIFDAYHHDVLQSLLKG